MSMRELVTGGAACAPEGAEGSSSSHAVNPLARLANSMLYEPEERAQYERGLPGDGAGPSRPMPPPAAPGRLGRFAGPPGPPLGQMMPPPGLHPAEQDFENAFNSAGVPPAEMRNLEQRAYAAAVEMHGNNPELVEREVSQFLHEIQTGMVPPPVPVMAPGPGPMMRAGPARQMPPPHFEGEFESAFNQRGRTPVRRAPPNQMADEFQREGGDWVNQFSRMQVGGSSAASATQSRTTNAANATDSFSNHAEGLWKESGGDFASEFAHEEKANQNELAAEFSQQENRNEQNWAQELADEKSWGDEFASLEGAEESYEEALYNHLGRDPEVPEYEFTENNPYKNHPNPMAEAERLLEEGKMVEASLALEAVVQNEPENSRGWYLLGEAQAECDDDVKAIAALKRCLQIGQTGESHRDALLSLGVSYANELNQSRALDYLKQWLDLHPDYQRFQPSIPASDPSDQFSAHGELLQRVFAALRAHPESPELHSIVGVLYNLSREYEEGQNAFMKAIQLSGNDYKLWNRLGATFANGENHEEALKAYRTAVDLKPGYVRAWVNVGTSYANQVRIKSTLQNRRSDLVLLRLILNRQASHDLYRRIPGKAAARHQILPTGS
uniref:Peroxin-5 n=3 Tax=Rhodosorus marinus TaxID=101924 RepID=A0A7S3A5H3_9RHOD|mmetsp:Transcript_45503/g.176980  ORF Transcript_45503/g.176980 Transcript_45503/m.176980 type:complete len:613 (+) Transcript_45503:368-2206(+)